MQLFTVNFISLQGHSTCFGCFPNLATLKEGSCNDNMTCTGGCKYSLMYS